MNISEHNFVLSLNEYEILCKTASASRDDLEAIYDAEHEFYDIEENASLKNSLMDLNLLIEKLFSNNPKFLESLRKEGQELVLLPLTLNEAWIVSNVLMGYLFLIPDKIWSEIDQFIMGLVTTFGYSQPLFKRFQANEVFKASFGNYPEWVKDLIDSSPKLDVEVSDFGDHITSPSVNKNISSEHIQASLNGPTVFELKIKFNN